MGFYTIQDSLSNEFNVIGIAVSGQNYKELKISNFIHAKGTDMASELLHVNGNKINRFLEFDEFVRCASYDREVEKSRYIDLIEFTKDLHEYMSDNAKLSEQEKPLLVSGILIAITYSPFKKGYNLYSPEELPDILVETINKQIENADIPHSKKKNITQPYSFISVHPELPRIDKKENLSYLFEIISRIEENIFPYFEDVYSIDVIGQFYGEFLKYKSGDKKGLGIVLTPKHITELVAELAELTTTSTVIDICCGTGSFLIASMYEMIKQACSQKEVERIKREGLIGIEQQPNMYALACSNMILRGDGKANLYQGSCFDDDRVLKIKPNIGMINPPYSQKGDGLHEFDFILYLLDLLQIGGKGFAIVPMSCAISGHPLKEKILEKHRLDAVMSLPENVFYPSNPIACLMVFTAHIPHEQNKRHKTWLGYWREDEFTITKNFGRYDTNNTWHSIKSNWLDMFFEQKEIEGLSIKQKINHEVEWCIEAYMETDYGKVGHGEILDDLTKYFAFKLLNK
jgi:type I restriction enzyme M protein